MNIESVLIGREDEIRVLNKAYDSCESEFVAVYGRRRIGKTFLVRNVFEDRFTFRYTGIFNVSNKEQLAEFYHNLLSFGLSQEFGVPGNWFEAFHLLELLISESGHERKIIFIDELPWMAAKNSRFIQAFEHFWNDWASARNDILLIICGSATSWIINNIFRSKGGLYNRVSYRIHLDQFSLYECELLAKSLHLPMTRNMIMEGYMVMGGIPYYWTKLDQSKSMAKNINDLFFVPTGQLHDEFNYLYASMFTTPEQYIKVVEALSGKKSGLTRDEIISRGKTDSSGRLSNILEDLIGCGLVRKYCHLGKKLKDALYQLIDCYTLFYFQFIKPAHGVDENYWLKLIGTPDYHTWCGLSFERLCLLHSRQLKAAIGISGIRADLFSWHIRKNEDHPGAQIDLLIDRADGIINVCEMKYAPGGYRLTASVIKNIRNKISILTIYLPRNKYPQPVLIASDGILRTSHSDEISQIISGDQLFMP